MAFRLGEVHNPISLTSLVAVSQLNFIAFILVGPSSETGVIRPRTSELGLLRMSVTFCSNPSILFYIPTLLAKTVFKDSGLHGVYGHM